MKTCGRSKSILESVEKHLNNNKEFQLKFYLSYSLSSTVDYILEQLLTEGIKWYGAVLVVSKNGFTPGSIIAYSSLYYTMTSPLF